MNKSLTIIIVAFLLLSTSGLTQESTPELSLIDIFQSREFFPRYIGKISSLNDGENFLKTENDSINIYNYKTGKYVNNLIASSQLIPLGDSVPINIRSYELNNNENKILFFTESQRIYRHSYKSKNYVYDIAKKQLQLLSNGEKQQLATFSPDGLKVAFVRDNNLFYYDLETNQEVEITKDGLFNNIIYGTTDWVYEEEFSFTKAFHWAPDGSSIAFYRFDESNVKEFQMTTWGKLYPDQYNYKYPKAGEENSKVEIHVYSLKTGQTNKRLISIYPE